ncbi:MAG: hypothetical protein ACQER9_01670 [Nanobdellota archaeon]
MENDIYFKSKENDEYFIIKLKDNKDIKSLIKIRDKHKGKILMDSSQNNPRKFIEKSVPDIIYGCEFHKIKDFGHQSNSGIDHVMMKMMAEKNISYGFCISDIKSAINKDNLKIIPRIKQNYMLAKKYGVNLIYFSGNEKFNDNERKSIIESITK